MHAPVRRALLALALHATLLAAAPSARGDAPLLTGTDGAALDRQALIRAVLARNPSLAAAQAAVRAAEARAEGAGSWADPRLAYSLAPRSLFEGERSGHRVVLGQPLFAWGKRGLERGAARGEATAARFELGALRLDLALATSQLFDDYYLAARSQAVNQTHRGLVEDLRLAALARYEASEAPKQAPLAAELEAARLEHREIELRALQRIAAARLNALLHRPPDAPLPPPPAVLATPDAARLLGLAMPDAQLPELRAAEARVEARGAARELAERARIPDVTLMAGYDGMWDDPVMRPMIGFEVPLPFPQQGRRAEIAEAEALREQAERELERVETETTLALAIARERFSEAHHALAILREQVLPAARDQAEAANAALAAGRADFASATDAERSWYEAELAAEEALVTASRRAAELLRALGRSEAEETR